MRVESVAEENENSGTKIIPSKDFVIEHPGGYLSTSKILKKVLKWLYWVNCRDGMDT